MYKHILIPTDGSETAEKAIAAGIEFAREQKARVTWFTAVPEYQLPSEAELMTKHAVSVEDHNRKSRQEAERILAGPSHRANQAGVPFETDFAMSDHPYEAIIAAAKKHGCDLIFMASHGRKGISAFLHGSETKGVLTHSTIPTLVYR